MKIINKILAGITVTSLLTYYATPVFAYMNEEIIYSNLDSSGKAYKSSVTTIVEDKKGTNVNQDEIDEQLPIETKITYYLDGKEMDSSKIAGKKGRITIKMEFENNDKHDDVYTPFVVVSGLMIDNKANSNIEIVNGKLLTNGNTTVAIGLALPGMQESLDISEDKIKIPSSIEISMDTDKFELGNIFVYASPKIIAGLDISMSDFDEVFDKVDALETASKALESGSNTLTEGIKVLDTGALELSNGAKSVNDGVTTLKAGANDLSNGASTLNAQYGQLDSGISNLQSGVATIGSGATALDSGAGSLVAGINQVNDGMTGLVGGISQVDAGANGLVAGISQVDAGANGLVVGISQVDTGVNGLINGISQLDGGVNTIIQGIEENIDVSTIGTQKATLETQISTYSTMLSAIPSDEVLAAGLAAEQVTAEQVANYQQTRALLSGLVTSLQANYNSLVATESLYGGLNQLKDGIERVDSENPGLLAGANALKNGIEKEDGLLAGANALKNGIEKEDGLLAGANALKNGIEKEDGLLAGANALKNGIEKEDGLLAGANSLKNGTAGLTSGVSDLTSGVNNLKEGSTRVLNGLGQLANGSITLKNGVVTLSDGTNTLYEGTLKLTEGSKQLVEGSQTLSDGIKQFNSEGISKISDLVNIDGKNFIRKIEKLEKLSDDYTSFASKEERDELKFISIIDSIKVETKNIDTKTDKNSKSKK